jgi:hypothetical protein
MIETTDYLDIPDFLKVANITPLSPELRQRLNKWLRRRPTKEAPQRSDLPKHMDATSWALLKEQERAKEAKKQERLAYLKQLAKDRA